MTFSSPPAWPTLIAHVAALFVLRPLKQFYWARCHDLQRWREDRSNARTAWRLLRSSDLGLSLRQRLFVIERFWRISAMVNCPHTQHEMLSVAHAIFASTAPRAALIIEAGAYKGGSTAKLSLCAMLANRTLAVYDSFVGIPENDEVHQMHFDQQGVAIFKPGDYAGSLEDVKNAVARFGAPEMCSYHQGWFCDTLNDFNQPVAVAYIDVDLISSTRDCLTPLYRNLIPGGVIFSQDGHLSGIIDLLKDEKYWREVGGPAPIISGLGHRKLIKITKPF
jgi:O-methyltransferase